MENTKKKARLFPLLLLLIIGMTVTTICLCGLAWQVFRYDCLFWTCAPTRAFTTLELDIPEEMYPTNALFGTLARPSEIFPAIEASQNTVFWDEGDSRAIYIVQRYSRLETAVREYDIFYGLSGGITNESELDIQNLHADEFMAECGLSIENLDRCRFVSRYQEYIIIFNSYIDQKMTEQEYLDIVYFIDAQMTCRLNENCIEDNK